MGISLSFFLSAPLLSQQFTDVAAELEVQNTSLDDSSPSGIGATAWVDVNADGYYDLWISRPFSFISPYRPAADRLFINHQETNEPFTEEAAAYNLEVLHGHTSGASFGDINGDGLIDMYVPGHYGLFGEPDVPEKLMINKGGTFIDSAQAYGLVALAVGDRRSSMIDIDGDGDLDIFVLNAFDFPAKLYRNDGGYFTDIATEVGLENLDYEYNRNKNEANWIDFDNDGDLDVHFHRPGLSRTTPGRLMRNDLDKTGSFTDVTRAVGLEPQGDMFQSTWLDYNNDGYLDVYIGHLGGSLDSLGTRLFRNDLATTGRFVDVSLEVGLDSIVSSTAWADIDHDGDLDFLATGDKGTIYYNNNGSFTPQDQNLLMLRRSAGWADFDNDGDLDYFGGGPIDQHKLLRNNQNDSNYLKIRLLDLNGGLNRQGSQIRIYHAGTDSLVGMRMVGLKAGGGADMYDVHFGLDGSKAYDIAVHLMRKMNGQQVILTKHTLPYLGNVIPTAIGGFLEIRDTFSAYPAVNGTLNNDKLSTWKFLQSAYPNPFNSNVTFRSNFPVEAHGVLEVFNLLGRKVSTIIESDFLPGEYLMTWDGSSGRGVNLPSGVYLVRLSIEISAVTLPKQFANVILITYIK
ncbi:MAG: T9SS type A sorting domain-containing protein [Candidatus Marinimicrobia bacterium]|nr:T9SS type A sorting domain-containing protein [Candidatus Neomarinimicrobiota bacterium]